MTTSLPRPAIEHVNVIEPDLPLLHDRTYSVRAYRRSETEMLIRGQVLDQKPPGIYLDDDPEPLAIHHMVVDIVVRFPDLEIVDAQVVMETHPNTTCPAITDHYRNLIGLSIARGFTHRIRELFGGPRGCTHTTALLQAMAPVAVQSIWSMRAEGDGDGTPVTLGDQEPPSPEEIRQRMAYNINSCHVWREDGEHLAEALRGEMDPPLWIVERMEKLGLDPATWKNRMQAD